MRSINIVQLMFVDTSNAAMCTGAALKGAEDMKSPAKFKAVMAALHLNYEPSGVVAAMELKETLKNWQDSGRSHTDWEAGYLRITSPLLKLEQVMPEDETDHLIIDKSGGRVGNKDYDSIIAVWRQGAQFRVWLSDVKGYDHEDSETAKQKNRLRREHLRTADELSANMTITLELALKSEREVERKKAKDASRRLKECYVRSINVVQLMFVDTSNAAMSTGAALKGAEDMKSPAKFKAVMAALRLNHESSGIVAAMELKETLKNWQDSGRSHTDWEAGYFTTARARASYA